MCQNTCSNCKFRGSVAGSAHISCNYPKFKEVQKLELSMLILGNLNVANDFLESNFGFTVSQHPVSSGWFNFPFDFDPAWIQGECTKHSNNPEVMKAVKAEEVINTFMLAFKKVSTLIENSNNKKNQSLHERMKSLFQKFNIIQTQEEFFVLVEELKPLIEESNNL